MSSTLATRRDPTRFRQVTTYCLFIGHGRSGHSIIGAMLDAHPEVILSDELDAMKYLRLGFSRDQVFHLSAKVAGDQAHESARSPGDPGRPTAITYQVNGRAGRRCHV